MVKYRHLKDEQALEGREVSMKTEQIKNAKQKLQDAIAELKRLYNDRKTSICEMAEIMNYASLLNRTDFVRTITN